MSSFRSLFILFAVAFLPVTSHAMRCGQNLVSIGETNAEVIQKCGLPESQQVVGSAYEGATGENHFPHSETSVEQWSYNLGSGKFLQILTFTGGRLTKIEEGSRVGSFESSGKRILFTLGETAAEIQKRYGEPMMRSLVGTEMRETIDGVVEEKVELWTYDPGDGHFLQILTFRGGRLVKVEDGARQ